MSSLKYKIIFSSPEMKYWVVIGIAGVTNGGKTTLARHLHEKFNNSVLFSQDEYFFPENDSRHIFIPSLNHINWEIISSVDMEKMRRDVNTLLNRSHSDGTPHVVIIEGFLLLNDYYFSEVCDLKFFFTLSKEQCWERRCVRIYEPPDPPGYFDEVVWPEYEKHKDEAFKMNLDLICLDGTKDIDTIVNEVSDRINMCINSFSNCCDK